VVFTHTAPPPFQRLREPIEAYAASIVSTLQGLSGRPLRCFRHPASYPSGGPAVTGVLRLSGGVGATQIEVAFDAGILNLPLR
jgi:hypothetical protein